MTDVAPRPGTQDSLPPFIPEARDRMEIIHASEGFYPTTREEVNRAANLLADPYAGARHIGEVRRHQVKADVAEVDDLVEEIGYRDDTIITDIRRPIDPSQAVTRVLWTLGQYGIRAQSDKASLSRLESDLSLSATRNISVANERIAVRRGHVAYPSGLRHGWPQLIRYIDLNDFVTRPEKPIAPYVLDHAVDPDDYVLGDVFSVAPNDPEVAGYMREVLQSLTMKEARGTIDQAIEDQTNRLAFWRGILESVRDRQIDRQMKTVAKKILFNLDIAKA